MATVRGDLGVDVGVEDREDGLRDGPGQVGLGSVAGARRGRRPIRVLDDHPRAAEVEGGAGDVLDAGRGKHHRQVVAALHDVVGCRVAERHQLQRVRERPRVRARDLDAERQRVRVRLGGAYLEDLLAGRVGHREHGFHQVVHLAIIRRWLGHSYCYPRRPTGRLISSPRPERSG